MISLYGGRLVIQRRLLSENWKATIKITAQKKATYDLGTPDVRTAFIRAQHHYLAMRTNRDVDDVEAEDHGLAKCWSCMNWLPRSNECSFGFPEAQRSRGRYAAKCELYDDGRPENH